MTSDIGYTPILPDGWQRPRGFSHGVVANGTKSVRIAGQIGREPGQAQIPAGTDAGTQWRVALTNLAGLRPDRSQRQDRDRRRCDPALSRTGTRLGLGTLRLRLERPPSS